MKTLLIPLFLAFSFAFKWKALGGLQLGKRTGRRMYQRMNKQVISPRIRLHDDDLSDDDDVLGKHDFLQTDGRPQRYTQEDI